MADSLKKYQLCVVVIAILSKSISWAQRPSFAGSRPLNGLNQKDKYYSTTPSNTDIADRFGTADASTIANRIPFGEPQNPPVGYPVVLPEPSYTALTPKVPTMDTSVVFEDRFGSKNDNNMSIPLASPALTPSTTAGPLPLDAHGDKLLIDQLNQLPVDKRPFWFINYQAIEAQRNGTVSNLGAPQGSRASFLG